MKAYWGVEV